MMVTNKTQKAIDDLRSVLDKELGNNVVSIEIFLSNSEQYVSVKTKSAAQLKSNGISMKNIRGEWIK